MFEVKKYEQIPKRSIILNILAGSDFARKRDLLFLRGLLLSCDENELLTAKSIPNRFAFRIIFASKSDADLVLTPAKAEIKTRYRIFFGNCDGILTISGLLVYLLVQSLSRFYVRFYLV